MSDTDAIIPTTSKPRRSRSRVKRMKPIVVGGKTYVTRDCLADEAGVDPRTAQRKCTGVLYLGGVAMVEHEQALRDLLGLNQPPQPKPRTRGPYRKSGK
jgi:hypothetical protein